MFFVFVSNLVHALWLLTDIFMRPKTSPIAFFHSHDGSGCTLNVEEEKVLALHEAEKSER